MKCHAALAFPEEESRIPFYLFYLYLSQKTQTGDGQRYRPLEAGSPGIHAEYCCDIDIAGHAHLVIAGNQKPADFPAG